MNRALILREQRSIPLWIKVLVGVITLILSGLSRDPLLFFFGMTVIIFLVTMLYNKLEPPVLLFSAAFGWFFFQGQLINALAKGEKIESIDFFSATRGTIILLGLIAALVFFIGTYLASRNKRVITFEEIRAFLMRVNLERLMVVYLLSYVMVVTASTAIWFLPGLTQPFFVMSQFRWGLFFLVFVTVFVQDRLKFWLFVIIMVDIALSFFSFFAHFKEAIYFSFLSYWIFFYRNSVIAKAVTLICIVATFYLGAYWTVVKDDYRTFLNRGTGAQAVIVSREEAYGKLTDLLLGVQSEEVDAGIEDLVTRLSWIGAFDAVYNYVPKRVPHENGDLWIEGATRPFLPRLLFPDKKALADSKELNYYSGLGVDEKQTSISLSMVAGSYVDFGKYGMFVPIFLFGLFCGWVYKKAILWGRHPIVGYGLTMPMINLLQINEQSINRIVSALVVFLLAAWFISRFAIGPFLRFILTPAKQPRPKRPVNAPALG